MSASILAARIAAKTLELSRVANMYFRYPNEHESIISTLSWYFRQSHIKYDARSLLDHYHSVVLSTVQLRLHKPVVEPMATLSAEEMLEQLMQLKKGSMIMVSAPGKFAVR